MATALNRDRRPLDEFLAWEEEQPERHERIGGVVHAMVGGSLRHNRITRNVVILLNGAVPPGCETFFTDVKVVTPAADVLYPDVLVACGQLDGRATWLDAPVVVVEVLSPSTQRLDHTRKRWAYATIPSLRHYVLVGQDEPVVEVASWQDDGSWRSVIHRDPAAVAALPALGIELPCSEIFSGVTFGADGRSSADPVSPLE
ncbi:MAG TPA: Uma2 family endonuclease [Geminicoccaceae bacterium]